VEEEQRSSSPAAASTPGPRPFRPRFRERDEKGDIASLLVVGVAPLDTLSSSRLALPPFSSRRGHVAY
jgi:hypothetical protein